MSMAMTRFGALLVVLTLFGGMVPACAQPAATKPAAISVVLDDNYPPYIFRNSTGELQGILKDQWELWSKRSGIAVNLVATDWAKAQQIMRSGQADVIDTIFDTEERRKTLDFSKPYTNIEVMVFFHKSISGIVDADSLKGFTVGVKDGDACIDLLQRHGVAAMLRYPSYDALVKAAGQNEIRLFCIDKPPGIHLLYKNGQEGNFRHTRSLSVGAFHRAVAKGNAALLAAVEKGFAAISQSEYREIEEKWKGSSLIDEDRREQLRILLQVFLLAGAVALFLTIWNISLRRRVVARTLEVSQAQAASEQAREQLAATLEAVPDLLFELDLEGRYLDVRAGRSDLLAAPVEQLLGRTVGEILPPAAAGVVMSALHQAAVEWHAHGAQFLLDLPVGQRWFELSVARKKTSPDEPLRFIVISRDISERHQARAEIERLAFFDPLTQLPNRRLLLDRLRQELAASSRRQHHGALLFIDLDDFKTLNDTRGHNTGDLLLKVMAQRLQSCVRKEDTVARLGGDEFVVMLDELGREAKDAAAQAETVAGKLLRVIAEPCVLEEREHHTTASIGVCLFHGNREGEDELLKRADTAMYRAKEAGRNTVCFYDPAMQAALEARAKMESELRRALPEEQLLLHYQPQFDSQGRVVGAEALLRWRHPERGMVSPAEFIPLAEDTGLIVPIGQWVLANACDQLQNWSGSQAAQGMTMAVNVSARQFRQADFVDVVRNIIVASGINPARLKLELTESLVLDNVADSIAKMHALKGIGVHFSMDDFGTGYSSLAYLQRLPLDQLKIDQSFIRDIVSDAGNAAIVQTIIAMAGTLGMNVIAEGVETSAQRDFLLAHGCHVYQGYFFSPPVPPEELDRFF